MKVLDAVKNDDKELFIVLTDDKKEPIKYRTFSGQWYQYNNRIYFTSFDLIEDKEEIEKAYMDWVTRVTNDVFY